MPCNVCRDRDRRNKRSNDDSETNKTNELRREQKKNQIENNHVTKTL